MSTYFLEFLRKRPASVYWMCLLGIFLWIVARNFGFDSKAPAVSFVPMLCVLLVASTNLFLRKAFSANVKYASNPKYAGWVFAAVDFACIVMGLRLTGALYSPLWVVTFVVVAGETILEDRLVAALTRLVACIALLLGTLPTPIESREWFGYALEMFVRMGLIIAVSSVMRRLRVQAEIAQSEVAALRSDLALSDQRASLSREIHDSIGNALAATVLRMEVMSRLREKDGDLQSAELFREEADVVRQSMQQIRDWTFLNHPWSVDATLSEVLSREVSRWSRRTGIPVHIIGTDVIDNLGTQQTIPVLRIVQESLTNVVRHGVEVGSVCITVTLDANSVSISIRDDGKSAAINHGSTGLGMESMRGRATSLGGVLSTRATEQGFEVLVNLPLQRMLNRQFAQ
ncbi:MAG: sensor histidine kinase [Armatimonadota bacterium]